MRSFPWMQTGSMDKESEPLLLSAVKGDEDKARNYMFT